jgi:hypothetical protein
MRQNLWPSDVAASAPSKVRSCKPILPVFVISLCVWAAIIHGALWLLSRFFK